MKLDMWYIHLYSKQIILGMKMFNNPVTVELSDVYIVYNSVLLGSNCRIPSHYCSGIYCAHLSIERRMHSNKLTQNNSSGGVLCKKATSCIKPRHA